MMTKEIRWSKVVETAALDPREKADRLGFELNRFFQEPVSKQPLLK
jgi:hypothetical protein